MFRPRVCLCEWALSLSDGCVNSFLACPYHGLVFLLDYFLLSVLLLFLIY